MNSFFNYENDIMSALTRFVDAIVLGILWFVCSIPIVTVGASSTAFYYAFNKAVQQKRGYAWQEFYYGFKTNFKQSTKVWLLLLGIGLMSVVDCFILGQLSEQIPMTTAWIGILIALMALVMMWGLFFFPYLARFEDETKVALKNVAIITVAHFLWGILLLALFVIAIFASLWFPLVGIFAPTIYMVFANLVLERIFKKYMREEDLEREKEIEKVR